MKFRLKLFGLHLSASVCALALTWGVLYLGWYRWPGWYLSGALGIVAIMAGVDIVLGPSLTLIIANPSKPRRELARDIAIIAVVQLAALGYGTATLWHGRPLYYTYSARFLEMVQASELPAEQVALGRQLNPQLAPHWYSRPRWIYAPLPKDEKTSQAIVNAAVSGGTDVTQMPRFYRPWQEALPDIRANLRILDKMGELSLKQKKIAAQRMKELGFATDQPMVLPMLGRGNPIVVVIDPTTGQFRSWIRVD